ncbi:YfkD famly protein [Lentibacillus saliphilus]|uniref:YfkD famly protein n=1 Tax=Lentibacillus saliphilus TaxID=2737028 RepID=UPI001C30968A|nr:YfkD famly protein [Lentibacillus saliphilus]
MIKRKHIGVLFVVFGLLFTLPLTGLAKEDEQKEEKEEDQDDYSVPNHVLNIGKENTYPNAGEDQEVVEPSDFTKALFEDVDIPIDNPELIKVLNESNINPSPIGFGYRGMVYIGRWPLNYESDDTTINWEFQHINTNELNNLGGDRPQEMNYNQEEQKEIKGALTSKISAPEDVKKMMLLKAAEKTKLPLAYNTIIGKNTKKGNAYNVPVKKYGYLRAHAPAVSEKGQVTFGEVYFELKGTKKSLVIKNVTKQGIGAWIPIEEHLSFSFQLK